MTKFIEEFGDRQKNCKTVPEYSTKIETIKSEFNGKWIDVRTIVNKMYCWTRYCFDEKYFDLSLDRNIIVDRIERITYSIGPSKQGTEYEIFKGDRQTDRDWFIISLGVSLLVKEQN